MDFSHLLPNSSESTDDTVMTRASTWTPEQQIARLLSLCEAQMESALSESDVAVEALVKSFAGLIEAGQALGSLSDKTPQAGVPDLAAQLDALKKQTAAAIVAFQFYDKLTQRSVTCATASPRSRCSSAIAPRRASASSGDACSRRCAVCIARRKSAALQADGRRRERRRGARAHPAVDAHAACGADRRDRDLLRNCDAMQRVM